MSVPIIDQLIRDSLDDATRQMDVEALGEDEARHPLIPGYVVEQVLKTAMRVSVSHQLLGIYTRTELLQQRRSAKARRRLDRRIKRAIGRRVGNARFALGKAVLGAEERRLHDDCGW